DSLLDRSKNSSLQTYCCSLSRLIPGPKQELIAADLLLFTQQTHSWTEARTHCCSPSRLITRPKQALIAADSLLDRSKHSLLQTHCWTEASARCCRLITAHSADSLQDRSKNRRRKMSTFPIEAIARLCKAGTLRGRLLFNKSC
ncbi:hypothetical protein J6590_034816, partial [Homalodisca vitripennis]